jgi:hypothetical protein
MGPSNNLCLDLIGCASDGPGLVATALRGTGERQHLGFLSAGAPSISGWILNMIKSVIVFSREIVIL